MATSTSLQLPPQVRPVIISVDDFDKLLKEGRSFEEYFNFARQKMYISAEEEVLPPEIYGPSEGFDENMPEVSPETEVKDAVNTSEYETPDTMQVQENTQKAEEQPANEINNGTPAVNKPEQKPVTPKTTPEQAKKQQQKSPAAEKPKQPAKQEKKTKQNTTLPEYPTGSEGDDDPLLN